MIVPDINLLIYAYNEDAALHADAKKWWEDLMNGSEPVAVPWVVSCGFIRIVTNPRALVAPLHAEHALDHVRSWLEIPHVRTINPGNQHLDILSTLIAALGVAGNLTTDAHIAAIAIEFQAELHSNDADFSRMPGLKWHNPL